MRAFAIIGAILTAWASGAGSGSKEPSVQIGAVWLLAISIAFGVLAWRA